MNGTAATAGTSTSGVNISAEVTYQRDRQVVNGLLTTVVDPGLTAQAMPALLGRLSRPEVRRSRH